MTLDIAQEAFEASPSNKTAAQYLETLRDYEADDMIGDDTFQDGLGKIYLYLLGNQS